MKTVRTVKSNIIEAFYVVERFEYEEITHKQTKELFMLKSQSDGILFDCSGEIRSFQNKNNTKSEAEFFVTARSFKVKNDWSVELGSCAGFQCL
jgi:hypothetical protein